MTTQATPAVGWRKMVVQALLGGLVGAGGMFAAMSLLKGDGGLDWQPSQIVLVGVGMIYLLMGIFVGLGALAPRLFGARMLNVADAEEIVEERTGMGGSAVSSAAIGLVLMLLAYVTVDGARGPVTPAAAFWILLAMLVATTAASLWMWRSFDELWRRLTVEAGALTANLLLALLIVWGAAAATGLVAGPHPLDLVSAAFGSLLLATFIAAGRRGMMQPR